MPSPYPMTIAVALMLGAFGAEARATDLSDIRAMSESRITLSQAVGAAEAAVGGHAVDASVDDESREPRFEIDVRVGGQILEVVVSGVDGAVLGVRPNRD